MTITSKRSILAQYQTPNLITLYEDGSKIRVGDAPSELPESVDLKITDYCDAGCPFCHEDSTTRGKHCSVETIDRIFQGLPPGVEIAIGGGNPLAHPQLLAILNLLRSRGLITSLTVNHKHLNLIKPEIYQRIYGLGISVPVEIQFEDWINLRNWEKGVLHVIAGIHNPFDLLDVLAQAPAETFKVLILGYKNWGRGTRKPENQNLIRQWRQQLNRLLAAPNLKLSFDTLAVEQLSPQRFLSPRQYAQYYLGDEGEHSFYLDAVEQEFAISSYSPRMKLGDFDVVTAFQHRHTTAHPDLCLNI